MILNPFDGRSEGGDMPNRSLIPGLGGIGNPTGMNNQPGGIPGVNNTPPKANGGQPFNTAAPVVDAPVTNQPASTIPGAAPTPVGDVTARPGTGTDGTITGSNVGTMLGFNNPAIEAQLNNLYGNGVGTALYQYLSGGAGYNPAVAQALLAQNQPLEQQGRANVEEAFGAAGNRDSSSAALGLSNFESNFQLGQAGQLANLYQNSANNYANMFGGVINTAQLAEANKPTTLDTLSQLAGLLGGTGAGSPLGNLLSKLLGKLGVGNKPGSTPSNPGGNNKNTGGNSPSSTIPGTGTQLSSNNPIDFTSLLSMFPPGTTLGDIFGTGSAISAAAGDTSGGPQTTISDPGNIIDPAAYIDSLFGGSTSITDTMPTGPQTTTSSVPDYIPMDGGGMTSDMGGN